MGCDAPSVVDHPFAGFDRSFVVVNTVDIFRVLHAQLVEMSLGISLDTVHPFGEQQHVVARAGITTTINLVIGEIADEGLTAECPDTDFAILRFADLIQRAPFPERHYLFTDGLFIRFTDFKRVLRTSAHGIEFIVNPAPGDIR